MEAWGGSLAISFTDITVLRQFPSHMMGLMPGIVRNLR